MIRVLVVDDSATTREMISVILNTEPEIEVIGEAEDGTIGVELAAQLEPDVITMDVNMPRMNGYEATKQIMQVTPTPIVVVTTNTRLEMIHQGLDILLAGALEIVEKPSSLTNRGINVVGEELVAKVRAVAHIRLASGPETVN